jgi:hypothetical protein
MGPDLIARIDRDGLSFLARYSSRDGILRQWKNESRNQGGGSSPPRIVMAIILAKRDEQDAAKQLLAEQAQETWNPGHPAYVRSLAAKLGISLADVI